MRGVHPVFHVSVLWKHNPDTITGRGAPTPAPILFNGQEEWEVEEVLDQRRRGKGSEYLICWKGFGP
jgi:hypothetical protein